MSSAAAPAAVGSGKELANPPADGISNLRFSNHSNNLLVSSWDKTVRLYDADANVLKGEFVHPGAVLDCCFHDDSSGFSAGADHTVRRLVFSSSKEDVLGRHDGPVRCVEYSYAAGQVITGSWDKTVKCWDPRGVSGPEHTLVGTYAQPERVYSLSLVGNRLVVATAGRHVNIYDLRNMSQPEQKRDSSLKYQTRCVRCFPNGTGYALSSVEGRVSMEFFDLSESAQSKNLKGGPGVSGRVLPPVTGRSWVRVAVSSHCTGMLSSVTGNLKLAGTPFILSMQLLSIPYMEHLPPEGVMDL
ncbi:mitotic checkpoint protein BUB3.1-like isoform X3 [Miscanthus floridulus]|uniref:mitotic checkpoint protein BUB3.1-like isoform X3 n=1 Tax=Miscanthus floridulus TaxID=154761 RepID=UPI003459D937